LLTASATGATSFKWYLEGILIGGATSSTYNATQSGSYTAIGVNSCGDGTVSTAHVLTINTVPQTASISGATSACTSTLLTASATGATSFKWYLEGNLIGGATSSTYNATQSGSYTVIGVNTCGDGTVSAAHVLTITTVPQTAVITGADSGCPSVTLTASATGATSYRWYLGGQLISGATASLYDATQSGSYTAVGVNACGDGTASNAHLVTINTTATPQISAPANSFCTGGSVTLTSSSASGNQWYRNGALLSGATQQTYPVTTSGDYTVVVNAGGCTSAPSSPVTITEVTPPATPTVTAGSATTFCDGGRVVLTSSATTGNQWYRNGTLIASATARTYSATTAGSYTVIATSNGCPSGVSNAVNVTVNPLPAMPTIIANGPTTFCEGGSVTLTASSSTGNQWYRGGLLLVGETGQTLVVSTSGNYSLTTTSPSGCTSWFSNLAVVVVNPKPDATITAASPVYSGAISTASVAEACPGASFAWSITGGTILSGQNTTAVRFIAGAAGTATLTVTATNSFGCTDTKTANVTVQTAPFGAPPFFRATAGGTSATLNWAVVQTADHYDVYRSTDNVNWTLRGSSSSASFTDSGLTAAAAYLYRIRAVKADLTVSPFTPIDFATTIPFSNDPLAACDVIRAVHVLELRDAINVVRATLGIAAATFTDPGLAPGGLMKAVYVNELRSALAPALTAIGVTPAYTDPTVTSGLTVKRAHVNELRDLIR
jgi:hypothetical protein